MQNAGQDHSIGEGNPALPDSIILGDEDHHQQGDCKLHQDETSLPIDRLLYLRKNVAMDNTDDVTDGTGVCLQQYVANSRQTQLNGLTLDRVFLLTAKAQHEHNDAGSVRERVYDEDSNIHIVSNRVYFSPTIQ